MRYCARIHALTGLSPDHIWHRLPYTEGWGYLHQAALQKGARTSWSEIEDALYEER